MADPEQQHPRDDGPLLTALLLAVGVLGVSLAAPVAAATAAPALAVAFWRTAMATAVGAPYTLARRSQELRSDAGRSARTPSVQAGVWLAVHFALWIPSLRLTSVTAATALVCTTPVWTVAWARLRGSRVPGRVLLGIAVSLAGVLIVTGVDLGAGAGALTGDVMALGGGMAAAGYVLAGERARAEVSTASYTFVAYGVCAALLAVAALVAGQDLVGYTAVTWAQLGVLTLAAQLLGHSVLNRAVRTAGSTSVALATLLEVPGAALVAWVWLGQVPPVAVVPGAVLVVTGLAVVVLARRGDRATSRALAGDAPTGLH